MIKVSFGSVELPGGESGECADDEGDDGKDALGGVAGGGCGPRGEGRMDRRAPRWCPALLASLQPAPPQHPD